MIVGERVVLTGWVYLINERGPRMEAGTLGTVREVTTIGSADFGDLECIRVEWDGFGLDDFRCSVARCNEGVVQPLGLAR